MNPEVFAAWLRIRGHDVLKTASSYWAEFGQRAYQAFPYHWTISPSDEEITSFLKSTHAFTLRFSAPVNAAQGCLSYHVVYESPAYDLDRLGKWARKNVRRGLANCTVEPISFDQLADEGFALQADTLDRQGRSVHFTKSDWKLLCVSARDLPGFMAWGATVDRRLGASVITFQMEDCAYMLYQQCLREYMPLHVNNALSLVVTKALMESPRTKSILYGLHSLDAPSSVDEFKFRMGYTAKPVRQRVEFHPLLRPFVNAGSHGMLRLAHRVLRGSPTIAKAEGMFRFYLQGKLPIRKQDIPDALRANFAAGIP